MTYPEIKDLDGIYIRVERKGKWMILRLSDCTSEERKAWLQELDRQALDNVKNHFIACFDEMSQAITQKREVTEMLKKMYKIGFESKSPWLTRSMIRSGYFGKLQITTKSQEILKERMKTNDSCYRLWKRSCGCMGLYGSRNSNRS